MHFQQVYGNLTQQVKRVIKTAGAKATNADVLTARRRFAMCVSGERGERGPGDTSGAKMSFDDIALSAFALSAFKFCAEGPRARAVVYVVSAFVFVAQSASESCSGRFT